MSAPAVTDLRFVVVSGKGGVGRTTVAATLARVASAAGKQVLLAAAAASTSASPNRTFDGTLTRMGRMRPTK